MYVQLPGTFSFAEALMEVAKPEYILNGVAPHLLTIESASEEAFLYPYYYNYFWIGAQDLGTPRNHNFRWITGPNVGDELQYFGWVRGQPDSTGNTCIMVQYNFFNQNYPEWALVPCDLPMWILLEYEGLAPFEKKSFAFDSIFSTFEQHVILAQHTTTKHATARTPRAACVQTAWMRPPSPGRQGHSWHRSTAPSMRLTCLPERIPRSQ